MYERAYATGKKYQVFFPSIILKTGEKIKLFATLFGKFILFRMFSGKKVYFQKKIFELDLPVTYALL